MFLTFDPASLRYLKASLATLFEAAALLCLEQSDAYDMADAVLVFGMKSDYETVRRSVGDVGDRFVTSHALYVATIAASYALQSGLSRDDARALVCGALFHNVGMVCDRGGPSAPSATLGHDLLVASDFTDPAVLAIVRWHGERRHDRDGAIEVASRRIARLVRIVAICNAFATHSEWDGACAPLPGAALIERLNAHTPFYLDPVILLDFVRMTMGGAEGHVQRPARDGQHCDTR